MTAKQQEWEKAWLKRIEALSSTIPDMIQQMQEHAEVKKHLRMTWNEWKEVQQDVEELQAAVDDALQEADELCDEWVHENT